MNLNMANRQCCDLDIRDYKTNQPWMFAEFCNTTTAGLTGESVYAMKKGSKAIAFSDPVNGTMTLEFQVHPFKIYSLLSDGELETNAIVPVREVVAANAAGSLTLSNAPVAGSVFVYAEGDFAGTAIEGTVTDTKFTATEASDIAESGKYEAAYLVEKTSGVKKISFNNKKIPKDYRITMETLDKNEDGELIPIKITAYKATPQRNLELSFSSAGDPGAVTLTFDILEDRDGNVLDIVEIEDGE